MILISNPRDLRANAKGTFHAYPWTLYEPDDGTDVSLEVKYFFDEHRTSTQFTVLVSTYFLVGLAFWVEWLHVNGR
ncbi:hypothetical protein SUNI508_06817 [Seiridium unicorne]|uniref:Uncharacterized protein n=1 Tax=Seiridium unicorne TaxID=138068 RepID=A0ABR2V071_9PEZI